MDPGLCGFSSTSHSDTAERCCIATSAGEEGRQSRENLRFGVWGLKGFGVWAFLILQLLLEGGQVDDESLPITAWRCDTQVRMQHLSAVLDSRTAERCCMATSTGEEGRHSRENLPFGDWGLRGFRVWALWIQHPHFDTAEKSHSDTAKRCCVTTSVGEEEKHSRENLPFSIRGVRGLGVWAL